MNLIQLKHQYRASGSNLSYLRYLINGRINANAKITDRLLVDCMSSNITAEEYKERKQDLKDFGKLFHSKMFSNSHSASMFIVSELNNHYYWMRSLRNWKDLLNNTFTNYSFGACYDCSHLDMEGNFYSLEDDDIICSSCKENYYWNNDENYYQRDEWFEDEDEYDDDDSNGYNNIGSYHSSKRKLGHIPSSFDNRKPRVLLGLELEMETADSGKFNKDERAGHLLDVVGKYKQHTYALCEEDRSLDNGFEMVTSYTGLDVHKTQLEFFKHRFDGMSSHNTSTCGLHIHICKSDMTTLHGAKMVFFINDASNLDLIKAIARRDSASYAKLVDKKSDKSWLKNTVKNSKNKFNQLRGLNYDRYESLNFQNDRTIEFRLFKGTLKYETIMACLEFTYATWHFCKDASIDQLTTKDFIEFICKPENKQDTRFLRVYLRSKGFEVSAINKVCPEHHLKLVA